MGVNNRSPDPIEISCEAPEPLLYDAPSPGTGPHILGISFDLDGTLYSVERHRRRVAWRLWRRRRVVETYLARVESRRGAPPASESLIPGLVRETAEALHLSERETREIIHWALHEVWAGGLRPRHVAPGVREALAAVDRRGLVRCIASDHPPDAKLRGLGLYAGWKARLDASALGALKPSPMVIREAASRMGLSPSQLLHVGDRPETDGLAARRAGARFLRFSANDRKGPSLEWGILRQLERDLDRG